MTIDESKSTINVPFMGQIEPAAARGGDGRGAAAHGVHASIRCVRW